MKAYVLLCHARSGSTLIARGLKQHSEVLMFGEVFNKNAGERARFSAVDGRVWRDDEDGEAFVRDVVYGPRQDAGAVGFKLMYSDVWRGESASAWSYVVARRDVRVVHIRRDDLLAGLISLEVARRSRQWTLDSQSQVAPEVIPPFRIEVERCEKYFAKHVEWGNAARAALTGHRYRELEYARDISGRFESAMQSVFRFLDVPPVPVRETLIKQATLSPRRQLSNYDELAAHFQKTELGRFFDSATADTSLNG
jgi:LPS sulfotransferase NodH